MIALKIIRKIGKILRGGAGRKEIFLGMLCGVLIGFNPGASLTLALAILITLLLNANMSFTLLGAAFGKILGLALAPITFHTGYFIIHNTGMEDLFRSLCNAPVTALMDLNVYAMIGSLPYALVIGIASGAALGIAITNIRTKMLDLDQHEIIGKTFGNKLSRLLLRLAFGKSKLSLEDEIPRQAPLFRKSGLILVGSIVIIGLLLEFLLLDMAVKSGLQSAIAAKTGAEVNIAKAHLSLAGGKLELENLQVTDPDKPTHNLIQIDTLAADISINDLLRNSYAIELLAGSTLKRDVLRENPGKVYIKERKEETEKALEDQQPGKSLEAYFAKAQDWKKYGAKAHEYLQKRKENTEAITKGEKPKASKEAAVADAKNLGYLNAAADLVADRPAWTIRTIQITDVRIGKESPAYTFVGLYVSSHPELNAHPTILSLMSKEKSKTIAKLLLRFDHPAARHALSVDLAGIAIDGAIETADTFPLNMNDGKADIKTDGTFTVDQLDLPFTITIHDLKADVEKSQTVMGMDAETATEVFSSMEQLQIDGALSGSLLSPRVNIDYDKLTANMKEALVAAGKKELSKRANQEMDKAKDELQQQAGEELEKLMESDEAEEMKSKAKDAFKKLF